MLSTKHRGTVNLYVSDTFAHILGSGLASSRPSTETGYVCSSCDAAWKFVPTSCIPTTATLFTDFLHCIGI